MKLKTFTKALLISSLMFTGSAFAKTIIKIGHYNSDVHPSNIALQEYFKKTIEEKQKDATKSVFSQITSWEEKIKL